MKYILSILEKIKNRFLGFWEKYMASYGKSIKDGYVTNAFSPLVWFDVFLIPLLALLIYCINDNVIKYVFLVVIVILVLFTLGMYLALFKKDPKLLQSEKYRIEDKKLDLIAQQGITSDPITVTQLLTTIEIKDEIGNE